MHTFALAAAGFLLFVMQVSVTVHVLLHKNDVKSSIGWIGLVWLTPVVGSVLYVVFGINRIHRKAIALSNRGPDIFKLIGKTPEEVESEVPPPLWQLLRLGYKVHPQHLTMGNTVEPLLNGDEAYPQMCAAIAAARKEVLIQSYIFNNDSAGKLFEEPLRQAVKNGAKVRVLIDGVGLHYSKPDIARLMRRIEGVTFSVFLPSRKPVSLPFVNLRNHRKLMVIDGQTAFFGGMNVAEGNLLKNNPKEPIADVTFKVRGPVIRQIERVFEDDWTFSGKKRFTPAEVHATEACDPSKPGCIACRIIPDGPDRDYGKIELLLLGALACAQKSVSIVTPYFLPDSNMLDALILAAMRGVQVEVIIPQKSNIFGMDWAMQANFARLLEKGVRIYRAQPPFDHSKLMVMDDAWSFVGSSNWDVRSFKLNFETGMECFDADLAARLNKIIRHKKDRAHAVKRETYAHKPFWPTLRNNAFRLLTPYY